MPADAGISGASLRSSLETRSRLAECLGGRDACQSVSGGTFSPKTPPKAPQLLLLPLRLLSINLPRGPRQRFPLGIRSRKTHSEVLNAGSRIFADASVGATVDERSGWMGGNAVSDTAAERRGRRRGLAGMERVRQRPREKLFATCHQGRHRFSAQRLFSH